MKANEIFDIKLKIDDELCIFTGRVLYWWEEQDIKTECIYEEETSGKLILEHSKIYMKTINKFLTSVRSNDRLIDKSTLHEMSLEKNKNIEWANVLHLSAILPLYNAYVDMSGSSTKKLKEFRKKVLAVFDQNLRVDSFGDFQPPSELIEFNLIEDCGVLTRGDILSMSYADLLKYQTIKEIKKRYMSIMPGDNTGNNSQNDFEEILRNMQS